MQVNKRVTANSLVPTMRQRSAIAGMIAGKTAKDAMVTAGYTESTARNPQRMMRRERVASLVRSLAPQCTQELIEGTTVRAMVGKDIGHALAGATLAARLRGLLIERRESVNLNVSSPSDIAAMRAELSALYDGAPPTPGHDATLTSQPSRAAKSSVSNDIPGTVPHDDTGECG